MRRSGFDKRRTVPTASRIVVARFAQFLTLCAVLVGLWLSSIAAGIGVLLAWQRLVDGSGGSGAGRWVEGFLAVLLALLGLAGLAASLWLAWVGVERVGARVAGAPLARMAHGSGFGSGNGGFFDLRRPDPRVVVRPSWFGRSAPAATKGRTRRRRTRR